MICNRCDCEGAEICERHDEDMIWLHETPWECIRKLKETATMASEDEARVTDALRWVAQEARAVVMVGTPLPKGSRLREALKQLAVAYSKRG